MSFIHRSGLLRVGSVASQSKRFRGKINVQKPRKPHFERALMLDVTRPIVVYPPKPDEIAKVCEKNKKLFVKSDVENPLQRIYANELLEELETSKLVAFYHANPANAATHYKAKVLFFRQNMTYKNYGKETVRMAVEGTKYETVLELFMSHNMIVFSKEAEIKKLLNVTKKFPHLILLAGILEDRFVSKDELVYYSNIKNLETAQCQLVQTLESVGGGVANALVQHQHTLVSQLAERIKQLETK